MSSCLTANSTAIAHYNKTTSRTLRQLGCAIPAGVEIAYHTTALACDHFGALADGDDAEMPTPIQIDFENGFNNIDRAELQEAVVSTAPSLCYSLLPWAWQPLCY